MRADLAEKDGHNEKIQQQRLGELPVIKCEKQDREEDSDILICRTTEGRTQQLQPSDSYHKSSDPEREKELIDRL